MSYDNELRGVLFKNDEKETEKHPDYKGSATIEGVDYFLDAWINVADSGRKYMSLKFKVKQKQQSKPQTHGEMKRGRRDDNDAPPF